MFSVIPILMAGYRVPTELIVP